MANRGGEAKGLSQTPFVSVSEALLLMAFGAATIDASPEARLPNDPEDFEVRQRPEAWPSIIQKLEAKGRSLQARDAAQLARLKVRLAAFEQSEAALRDAEEILFTAHVEGRIEFTGYEQPPRGPWSTERLPIPPAYFAERREINWLDGHVRPALDGPDGQVDFEGIRKAATWKNVTVRRSELLRLWEEVGSRVPADDEAQSEAKTLPPWLSLAMAIGWVMYRTTEASYALATHDALLGDGLYPRGPRVGSSSDLQAALLEGRLVARGALAGGIMQEIPAVEWSRLAVRPAFGRWAGPFTDVVVAAADLLSCFPAAGESNTQPLRQKPKPVSKAALVAWYRTLDRTSRETMRQVDLLAAARAAFPENTVARDRVYELTGRRKRGPRPFSDKTSG